MQRRRVGGGWVRLMCTECLKAFLVWLIGWLRSDRMGDCRFNPQLLGYVCSRSFCSTPFFFLYSSLLLSVLFPPSFLMHAYVVLKVSFSGKPFLPLLIYSLLLFLSLLRLACPLLQLCSEIRWLSSPVLSHHCSLSLYGHIIFGETGRGWKKAANIFASVSLDSFFVCVCVRACTCVPERERGRQRERDSLKPQWHIKTLRIVPFSKIALPWNANIFWWIPSYRYAAHSAVFPCMIKQINKKIRGIHLLRGCFCSIHFKYWLHILAPCGGQSDYLKCPLTSVVDTPKWSWSLSRFCRAESCS